MKGERVALLALPVVAVGVVAVILNWDSIAGAGDVADGNFKPVGFAPNEPLVNPVVLKFDTDLAEINSGIRSDLDRLRDILDERGTGDVGCFNAIERDIEGLQQDLHRKYQEYLNVVNEQGGVISEAQDYYYREKIDEILAKIKVKMDLAERVALRVDTGYCA